MYTNSWNVSIRDHCEGWYIEDHSVDENKIKLTRVVLNGIRSLYLCPNCLEDYYKDKAERLEEKRA